MGDLLRAEDLEETVRAQAAAWQWIPYDADIVTTTAVDLVLTGGRARVRRATPPPDTGTAQFVAAVRDLAARHGATDLTWVVRDGDTPADLDDVLAAQGSTMVEDLEILARPLETGPTATNATPGIDVRRIDTPDLLDEAYAIDSAVLGTPVRSARFRQTAIATLAAQVAAGPARTAYRFAAVIDGTTVATAGLTLDARVARLWGAAVLPRYRDRGVYRALLAARLLRATAHTATLALTKARTDTSAPILRRAGFRPYGRERHHRLSN